MKKTVIIALAIIMLPCAVSMAQTTVGITNKNDSVSYVLGVANSNGLRNYAITRLGVDSTNIDDFLRGLRDGVKERTEADKAYARGLQIASDVTEQQFPQINTRIYPNGDENFSLNKELYIEGFIAATSEAALRIEGSIDSLGAYLDANAPLLTAQLMETKYGANKQAGADFLAKKAKEKGVQKTASGLLYKVITEGKGEKPKATDQVKVNYKGTLIDGTVFDSSYERNEPATFRVNGVIKGWTEALELMPAGSKWELYIPQDLAYGERDSGKIPPFSALVFEVELLEIVPAAAPRTATPTPTRTLPAANGLPATISQ